jgi:hypothetical protein
MRAAVAQAFDERRNGWVLRQDEFPWNENRDGRGRQPHLPADLADRSVRGYREYGRSAPLSTSAIIIATATCAYCATPMAAA